MDNVMICLLDDWAWWVRDRFNHGTRCHSLEGRYLRPVAEEDDVRRQPRRMVDVQQCLAAERAITHPEFPRVARGLLVGWFAKREPRSAICKKCGISSGQFESELDRAADILRNRLGKATQRALAG